MAAIKAGAALRFLSAAVCLAVVGISAYNEKVPL